MGRTTFSLASPTLLSLPVTLLLVSVHWQSRRASRQFAGGPLVRSHSRLRRQLSAAVTEQDPRQLRRLLTNDADPLSVGLPDLLHCACANGNLANVALLIRHGANVDSLAQPDRYIALSLGPGRHSKKSNIN